MEIFDFGSPALQAMSVPAIAVLVGLAVLTLRSVAMGDRATMPRRVGRPAESTAAENEKRWRGVLTDLLTRRG